MKRIFKKFAYVFLLALHLDLVIFIPIIPWVFLLAYQENWIIPIGIFTFLFIQLPIIFYSIVKDNSIVDKLIDKIIQYEK